MLYDELRKEVNGLTRVPIRLGPSQLRDDVTPPPVLYDIEDPWGRFDFDPNSRPWNDQLGDFAAAARPDRLIVATSRLDVAQASGALATVKPRVVGLEVENYGKAERQRLYRSRIDSLPRGLQPLARGAERQVLDRLATPLEIQKFFDALRNTGSRRTQEPDLDTLLRRSTARTTRGRGRDPACDDARNRGGAQSSVRACCRARAYRSCDPVPRPAACVLPRARNASREPSSAGAGRSPQGETRYRPPFDAYEAFEGPLVEEHDALWEQQRRLSNRSNGSRGTGRPRAFGRAR